MADTARPADLDPLLREAIDAAVGSAWQFFARSAAQGLDWDDIAGCRDLADYRAKLAAEPGLLLETCQALLDYSTGLTEAERTDCRRVVAIADILALRDPPPLPAAPPPPDPVPPEVIAASPAALEPAPFSVLPAPLSPARSGLWPVAVLTLVVAGAGLYWLWSTQPAKPPTSAATTAARTPAAEEPAPSLAPPAPAAPASPVPPHLSSGKPAVPITRATPQSLPTAKPTAVSPAIPAAKPTIVLPATPAAQTPAPAPSAAPVASPASPTPSG